MLPCKFKNSCYRDLEEEDIIITNSIRKDERTKKKVRRKNIYSSQNRQKKRKERKYEQLRCPGDFKGAPQLTRLEEEKKRILNE